MFIILNMFFRLGEIWVISKTINGSVKVWQIIYFIYAQILFMGLQNQEIMDSHYLCQSQMQFVVE